MKELVDWAGTAAVRGPSAHALRPLTLMSARQQLNTQWHAHGSSSWKLHRKLSPAEVVALADLLPSLELSHLDVEGAHFSF